MQDRTKLPCSIPTETADDEFFAWLLAGSRVVSVVGTPRSGKTRVACALLMETIVRRHRSLPDELRFRYVSAPWAYAEMARTRFDTHTNFDNVMRYAGMLVLDDLDKLEERDLPKALHLISMRSDDSLLTVVGIDRDFFTSLTDESYKDRAAEGLVLWL